MAKRKRFKITLPEGKTFWLDGDSLSDAFIDGWQRYSKTMKIPQEEKKVITVQEFIEKIYKPTYYPTLKPRTKANYDQYFRLNILPFLGSYQMNEVGVDTIQQFFNWMACAAERGRKKNLNRSTIERVRGLTSRIFRIALEMKIISDTPFKNTLLRIKAEEGGHHNAVDDDEIKRIKREIPLLKNEEERLYMTLLAFTGLRPEEVYGLRWDDLNLEKNYGQVTCVVIHPNKSKAFVDTPKTQTSSRTFLITQTPKSILMAVQKEEGYILGGEKPWCYSHTIRVKRRAFANLRIKGITP